MRLTLKLIAYVLFGMAIAGAQSKVQSVLFEHTEPTTDRVEQTPQGTLNVQEYQPIPFKSVTLAVVLSTIVPGTGELYAGNFETGKYAMMAEAAIWVTYAALYTHGNWVRQDARLFATEHAGANFSSKGDKFDVDIGNYSSVAEYNQAKLRSRENDLLYTDPSFYWQWDSDADRAAFKSDRIRSDQIYQNAKFVIAAAVVNRIFSAFSAGRATAAYNRKILLEGAWNLEAYPTSTMKFADGVVMNLSYRF
jgi:hypothetical protein